MGSSTRSFHGTRGRLLRNVGREGILVSNLLSVCGSCHVLCRVFRSSRCGRVVQIVLEGLGRVTGGSSGDAIWDDSKISTLLETV